MKSSEFKNFSKLETHSMKVHVTVLRHVVIKYNVDPFNVHSTSKQVSGDKDTLLEVLELLVTGESEKGRF